MFRHDIGGGACIRLFGAHDATELFRLVDENRMGLREWLPWLDDNRGEFDSLSFIRSALRKYADNGSFDAGIWHDGRLAGSIGYHPVSWDNKNVSIGYWLGHHARGKGLMTRACSALVTHAFETLLLHRVEIRCAVPNLKSQKVPRRLGFKEEGILRQSEWLYDRFVDQVVFAQLKHERIAGTGPKIYSGSQ